MSWRNSIVIHLPVPCTVCPSLCHVYTDCQKKRNWDIFLISILGFWLENWNCNCGFKCSNGTISYVHPVMFVFCNCALLHVLYSPAEGSADLWNEPEWGWVDLTMFLLACSGLLSAPMATMYCSVVSQTLWACDLLALSCSLHPG